MRELAVTALVLFVLVYSLRNWFGALCILVAFTALQDYPGLPNPFETRGINHWSVMLAGVTVGWMLWRLGNRPRLNLPPVWVWVVCLYVLGELVALVRLCADLDTFRVKAAVLNEGYLHYTVRAVFVDCAYSPMRYMWMAFLLADGARTRRRLLLAIGSVLLAVFLYALVVNKEIPLSGLASDAMRYRHRIEKWTNRHPNDLARVFAAAFWVGMAFVTYKAGSRWMRLAVLGALGPILLGLGHTLSRGGYLGFAVTGVVLSAVTRSWRLLWVLVAAGVAVVSFAPSVVDRMLTGLDTGSGQADIRELTAGRSVIWPAAISAIEESPLLGYGFYGYVLSAAMDRSLAGGGGEKHPHNAYLETLLDVGLLGAPLRLGPFFCLLGSAYVLIRKRRDEVLRLCGVVGLCWATTTLIMGLTGQHFGLTQNLFTFWCVCGLVARALTVRDRAAVPVAPRRRATPAMRWPSVRPWPAVGVSGAGDSRHA